MRSVAGETKQLARPHRHSHSGIKETHPSRPKARILSTPRILHLSVSRGNELAGKPSCHNSTHRITNGFPGLGHKTESGT